MPYLLLAVLLPNNEMSDFGQAFIQLSAYCLLKHIICNILLLSVVINW